MDVGLKNKTDALKPFLTDYIKRIGLSKNSGRLNQYHCPLCGSGTGRNKTGAFCVYDNNTRWHCHACGKGGDLLDLISKVENISWGQALKLASDTYLGNQNTQFSAPRTRPAAVRSCIASVDKRNAFYAHLMGALILSDKHRADLIRRGVRESDMWKYRSIPDRMYSNTTKAKMVQIVAGLIKILGDTPAGVPGFYTNASGEWTIAFPCQGFLIPVKDLYGRIQGLQCRADNPGKKGKYRWVSSNPDPSREFPFTNGTCAETAIHCSFAPTAVDTLYLTEGPLKGDIASSLLDRNFISITGITSLSPLSNVLAAFKKRGVVRVVCALDMDRFGNDNVVAAVDKIKGIVQSAGLEFHDFIWNPNFANDGLYKGIDDWAFARTRKSA